MLLRLLVKKATVYFVFVFKLIPVLSVLQVLLLAFPKFTLHSSKGLMGKY